jgi:hypothetical protein
VILEKIAADRLTFAEASNFNVANAAIMLIQPAYRGMYRGHRAVFDPAFQSLFQKSLWNLRFSAMANSPAANVIQAAYRGHRTRREFSAVRTSHDGNPPVIPAGNSNNNHDGNQPATSVRFPWIEDKSPRERSTSFRASAGVSRRSDLATPRRKDGIQPTISAGNLYPSLDGNEQAEPGHSGSRILSAAAEVFLPNDADFVSRLASSARQHNRSFDTPLTSHEGTRRPAKGELDQIVLAARRACGR